jgi:hypothetical protein
VIEPRCCALIFARATTIQSFHYGAPPKTTSVSWSQTQRWRSSGDWWPLLWRRLLLPPGARPGGTCVERGGREERRAVQSPLDF